MTYNYYLALINSEIEERIKKMAEENEQEIMELKKYILELEKENANLIPHHKKNDLLEGY